MTAPLLESVPPRSLEAEQATLGSMLVEREAIARRLGRIERAPLTEDACDAICEHFARRQ